MGTLSQLGNAYVAGDRISLLDGRLTVQPPSGAVLQPVAVSLMGAPAAPELETRMLLDRPPERLVMMTTELCQFHTGDLRPAVEQQVAGWDRPAGSGLKLMPVRLAESAGLEVFAVAWAPLDTTRQAVPVMDAFVRYRDSMVSRIACYVSPNATDDPAGCGLLAFGILHTLQAGPRQLSWPAREVTLVGADGQPALTAAVPPGWLTTTRRGVSFVVHQLARIVPFGYASTSVNIYLGGHPSPLHRQYPDTAVTTASGRLLGQDTHWYTIHPEDASVVHREALVPCGPNTLLHLHITTSDPNLSAELAAITESLAPPR